MHHQYYSFIGRKGFLSVYLSAQPSFSLGPWFPTNWACGPMKWNRPLVTRVVTSCFIIQWFCASIFLPFTAEVLPSIFEGPESIWDCFKGYANLVSLPCKKLLELGLTSRSWVYIHSSRVTYGLLVPCSTMRVSFFANRWLQWNSRSLLSQE